MVADTLVGACDDALTNGLALRREGTEQRGRGEAVRNILDLPGEIVCILDTGVRAETVERRMPVYCVAKTVDGVAGIRVVFCYYLIDVPPRDIQNLHG